MWLRFSLRWHHPLQWRQHRVVDVLLTSKTWTSITNGSIFINLLTINFPTPSSSTSSPSNILATNNGSPHNPCVCSDIAHAGAGLPVRQDRETPYLELACRPPPLTENRHAEKYVAYKHTCKQAIMQQKEELSKGYVWPNWCLRYFLRTWYFSPFLKFPTMSTISPMHHRKMRSRRHYADCVGGHHANNMSIKDRHMVSRTKLLLLAGRPPPIDFKCVRPATSRNKILRDTGIWPSKADKKFARAPLLISDINGGGYFLLRILLLLSALENGFMEAGDRLQK